jgi:hypothetical protein
MRVRGEVAAVYRDFAEHAADSPSFVAWAEGVADDADVQAWLRELPEIKRQPNLVFAAARWHGVPAPAPYDVLRRALLDDTGPIRATIVSRATQTNEVGRLATLVPAFATISAAAGGRPLALVEAGASAGLCLFPDRWGYRWHTPSGEHVIPPAPGGPVLDCEATGPAPLPEALPAVAWRGGVDLNPLDVADPDAMAWLTNLVWPEHDDRRRLLETAIEVARSDPPRLRRGDLLAEIAAVVDEAAAAAPDAVVVVFHSAVIAYLEDPDKERFADLMAGLVDAGRCRWVSNEGHGVLPRVTATGPRPPAGRFVLGIDGRSVGHTHGHGRSLHWW